MKIILVTHIFGNERQKQTAVLNMNHVHYITDHGKYRTVEFTDGRSMNITDDINEIYKKVL
jgi:hypothetical protein